MHKHISVILYVTQELIMHVLLLSLEYRKQEEFLFYDIYDFVYNLLQVSLLHHSYKTIKGCSI